MTERVSGCSMREIGIATSGRLHPLPALHRLDRAVARLRRRALGANAIDT